jgi:hypothetical protein
MFQTYVTKVDLDVAYVIMAIHTNVSSFSVVCFKSRSGVAHVAMCVGGWRTATYRSRLVLLPGRCRGSCAGVGWAWQACCCCPAMVHVRTRGAVVGCRR